MHYAVHFLYHVLGKSQREIAASLGVSLGKVQRTLRKPLSLKQSLLVIVDRIDIWWRGTDAWICRGVR
jgi:DNA-binding transcriptional regulator LsrR (DeoR family)